MYRLTKAMSKALSVRMINVKLRPTLVRWGNLIILYTVHVLITMCIKNYTCKSFWIYMYIFIIDINVASILSPGIYHMHQVQELVNQEAFAKYDRMLLMTSLDQMVDVMYCPRPACQYPVSVDKESNFGNCPSCRYVFCVLCQLVYHGLSPCKIKSGNSPFISFLLSSLCFNVAGFPIITCYVWQYLVYFFLLFNSEAFTYKLCTL